MSNYLTAYDDDYNSIRMVKKSNHLVRSYYDLSLTEQRIILVAISYINDSDCRIVEVPLASYKKYLGLESFNYEHFEKVLMTLRRNIISVSTTDKNTGEVTKGLISGWVDNIEVDSGFIYVDFNKKIWEYLINLKKEYTKYQLSYVLKLKSKHSIRLFEILKSYEYLGEYNVKTTELRHLLFLGEKYSKYNDFDKKILKPAIDEINALDENIDMKISYIPIKIGVRYDSIKFTISKNNESLDGNSKPQEVLMANNMTENELFSSIKTILMMKYKCLFINNDNAWLNHNLYTKNAMVSTYLSLMEDEWKDHKITNYKSFFAEHLKRLSDK